MFPFFNNYPGTDLHEIDLAYILKVCSEMVDKVRAQDNKIAAVEQLAQDLKDFVNNYFDNLDVQEEINNKIDEMAQSGTLANILAAPTAEAAAEWLAENLTPTTPPVDQTLTTANAAADAKVTGDRLRDITAEILHIIDTNDELGFMASDSNPYYTPHTYNTADAGFYNRIYKLTAGDIVEATAGYSSNIDVLCVVGRNKNYVSTIAKGCCRRYYYKAESDCYILISANPTSNFYPRIVIHSASETLGIDQFGNPVYGWKNGYKAAGGVESYNQSYIETSPIRIYKGDRLSTRILASNSCAAIFCQYDDGTYSQIMGLDSVNENTYNFTATKDGYIYVSCRYPDLSTGTINVPIVVTRAATIDKMFYSTTGPYATDFSSYTSMNQFVQYPFSGAIESTVTDRPLNARGVLTVEKSDSLWIKQTYYVYYNGLLFTRLLNVNGTPYSDWKPVQNPLYGKTIIGIGDSLMSGDTLQPSQTWLGLLQTATGCITYNYGLNGNTVAVQTAETQNPAMVNRISTIYSSTPTADYIVVIGGANDRRLNVPLGDASSTATNTFIGAIKSIINQLRQYYPKGKIVFMTNYCRADSDRNTLGLGDKDYVNAMIETCANMHVYCFNNYTDSGVDFDNADFSAWADEGIYLGNTANKHFSPDAYVWLMPLYRGILENR